MGYLSWRGLERRVYVVVWQSMGSETGEEANREDSKHRGRLVTSYRRIKYMCILRIMETKILLWENRLSHNPTLCWTLSLDIFLT